MSDENDPDPSGGMDHARLLETLAGAEATRLKALAEMLLPLLPAPEVLKSGTGLVMLPMRDTVQGTDFHLGEVLVAEAHLRLPSGIEGYGMVTGRDLERAMAMAVVDAAAAEGVQPEAIARFLHAEAARIAAADRDILRAVEATRVEMETF
ncbi:phosphonate C-P lyase system protein PhnG [Paracoccus siganidrum]|uniref:Phosphonate C-P lyase system protein PhnG n=1 Tax=Paracoccus siganidrum TaxID=1276757 RepID=A0A419A4X5_9RHOB|nr:phosphonate C-P lyase system protein PhnG [Paracoccus siganidrum]RJL10555.1 phosphonate C-P lyase system protein PhnG [Paracoccus siganidrum]RMC35196.1 phosphonate C-P lyase system protein PhnG [Paracoccus siganidrum]